MVFETTVPSFICLATLIGNGSLFLIVYKDRHLQTITNLFILNLAAADILVSLLSMPVTVVTIIKERWVFEHTACVALGFFTLLSFIASVMSLGVIALNRYFYIVKWNTYTKTFSKNKALLCGLCQYLWPPLHSSAGRNIASSLENHTVLFTGLLMSTSCTS